MLQDSTLYSFKEKQVGERGAGAAGGGGGGANALAQVYSDPTEVIDLRVFSSVKSSEDYTNRAHSFDVYSADMVFSMVAETETEKEGE